MKNQFLLFIFLIFCGRTISAQETITFPSLDGLTITADFYAGNPDQPYMILCHQAGYSRGEYIETAPKFGKLGYNCLAVDLRSGKEVNGINNETALLAKKKKKGTDYLDAEKDIIAAIDYAFKISNKKVVLVGSSYSASLVLKIASNNNKVAAVFAFSPGEYFGKELVVKEAIKNLDKPVFATSSKEESTGVAELIKDIKSTNKMHFTPSTKGEHGSRTLWKANDNYHEYWFGIMMFTRQMK